MKLGATAQVVNELMDIAAMSQTDAEKQARYDAVAAKAKALTNAPEYSVLALEGMGGGIGKQIYNVEFAKKYLTPFVSYLLEKANPQSDKK